MKRLEKFLRPYRRESILAPLFKLLEVVFDLMVPVTMQITDTRSWISVISFPIRFFLSISRSLCLISFILRLLLYSQCKCDRI